MIPKPIQILERDIIQIIDLETSHIIEIEIIPTIGTETIQMMEIIKINITDHERTRITDQTIKDQILIMITKDHAIFHKTEIQIIKTDRGIISNHHRGIIPVTKIHKKTIQVVHPIIKDSKIKYKLKKLNQTPLVLIIQNHIYLRIHR